MIDDIFSIFMVSDTFWQKNKSRILISASKTPYFDTLQDHVVTGYFTAPLRGHCHPPPLGGIAPLVKFMPPWRSQGGGGALAPPWKSDNIFFMLNKCIINNFSRKSLSNYFYISFIFYTIEPTYNCFLSCEPSLE